MTLWEQFAKPDELARYAELGSIEYDANREKKAIRKRCLTRAYRERKEK